MSEWLDLMLDEVARKQREAKEAKDEVRRRTREKQDKSAYKSADKSAEKRNTPSQSK